MSNYKVKLHQIKALAFDVDGVLTDGSILSTPNGDLLRTFDSKDRMGIRMWVLKNHPVGIFTGGTSQSIARFFQGIMPEEHVYLGVRDKLPHFLEFCNKLGITPEEVAYVGDDLPDIPVLERCGLAVCPCDAVTEVKAVCDYVSLYPGGHGCARDLIEQTLKVKGEWALDLQAYAAVTPNPVDDFIR